MTRKQQQIVNRNNKLQSLISNAVSCEYIVGIDRLLPNGKEVKAVSLNNQSGYKLSAYGQNDAQPTIYRETGVEVIDGVQVHYITF